MPKPTGPFETTLNFAFTADLEKSTAFYRDIIGLAPVLTHSAYSLFHATGTSYVGVSTLRATRPGGAIQEFVVGDRAIVDEWFAYLTASDVPVDSPPRKFDVVDAYGFFAEDPDGNLLEFLSFDDRLTPQGLV